MQAGPLGGPQPLNTPNPPNRWWPWVAGLLVAGLTIFGLWSSHPWKHAAAPSPSPTHQVSKKHHKHAPPMTALEREHRARLAAEAKVRELRHALRNAKANGSNTTIIQVVPYAPQAHN